MWTYFMSSLFKRSIFSRRGSKAPRKGDFNAPRVVNIDKKGSPLLSRRDSRLIILLCLWAVVWILYFCLGKCNFQRFKQGFTPINLAGKVLIKIASPSLGFGSWLYFRTWNCYCSSFLLVHFLPSFRMLYTLNSLKNVALRLSIFWLFPEGKLLKTDRNF